MKKFYCNGKKDFCEDLDKCSTNCRYFDGSGGKYRKVPNSETGGLIIRKQKARV